MSFRINTNVSAMNALRNLNGTNMDFGRSVTRLSTGLRINSAADDPAGLVFSENFRSQISGVTQAIRNNQDAINYAKTAEGALDEISRLIREARSLSVASANTGALSASQLQANQTQLNLLASSVDRIAAQTQFGDKRLLDGSSGINSVVVDAANFASMYITGQIGGQQVIADGQIDVDVTTAAAKATHAGSNAVASADLATYLATSVGTAGYFAINGTTIAVSANESWGEVVSKINALSGVTGVYAEAAHDGTNGSINLTTFKYGSNAEINLVDATGIIESAPGTASATGTDAVADVTVGGLTAATLTAGQGGNDGLTLTDTSGNRVVLTEAGNAVASYTGAGQVVVGSAQFQIGGNAGQTMQLSLGNFSASSLGFAGLDITTSAGANAAMVAIDSAIDELSRRRGEIGSFMRNALESNIRTLGIAKENLTATESTVRDTDIAEEMTTYTKLQILQQSGLAVLAQANAAPQSVLALLRG